MSLILYRHAIYAHSYWSYWEASHLSNSQVGKMHTQSHSVFTLEQYIVLTL